MPQRAGTTAAVLRRNLRCLVLHGALGALALNAVQPFLGIFAIRLGASNLEIALLSALPAVVGVAVLPLGGRWLDRFRRRQPAAVALLVLARCSFLLLAAVPAAGGLRPSALLVAAVTAMNVPATLAGLAWQALVADVIPPERRGQAMAERNRVMSLIGLASALGSGLLLDRMAFPGGYQLAFAAGCLLGLGEAWALARMLEAAPHRARPRGAGTDSAPVLASLREPLADPPFRRFTWASMVFHLGWQMPWPLFTRYDVSVLGASNTWLSLFTIANTLPSVITYGLWARLADRRGTVPALFLAALGLATFPLCYALGPGLHGALAAKAWVGLFASGVQLLLFNAVLELAPGDRRAAYLACYNALTGAAAVAAPLLGAALLERAGFTPAFLVASALRLLGGLLLRAAARGPSMARPTPAAPALR